MPRRGRGIALQNAFMKTLSRWLAALLIGAATGCGATGTPAARITAPAGATLAAPATAPQAALPAPRLPPTPAQSDLIRRINVGIESPYTLGDPIPLTADILAEFRMEQGRTKFDRYLDVLVYRGDPGNPVEDAKIKVLGAMREMEHGSFRLGASPEGGGHYTLSMPTIMPGQWFIDITVTSGGKETTIQLMLELFD